MYVNMHFLDEKLSDAVKSKAHSSSAPKNPLAGGKLQPNQPLKIKTAELTNVAKSSIFFPFTQPTVRHPTSGRTIKGRMPTVNKVLSNFGLKKFGGKGDKDGDGVKNENDCQPCNTMRQDRGLYTIQYVERGARNFGEYTNREGHYSAKQAKTYFTRFVGGDRFKILRCYKRR